MTLRLPPPSAPLAIFVAQLQAACIDQGVDCPVPAELLARLARKPPAAAVHRMARQLSQAWGRSERPGPMDDWQAPLLVQALAHAHAALALDAEPDAALTNAWARVLCRSQQLGALTELAGACAAQWAAHAGPLPSTALVLLQCLRPSGHFAATQALLSPLSARLAQAPDLGAAWLGALAAASRAASTLDEQVAVAEWLAAGWPNRASPPPWWSELPPHGMAALLTLAVRCVRLDLAGHALARTLPLATDAVPADTPPHDATTAGSADGVSKLLRLLAVHGGAADVLPWADRAVQRWPRHPGVRMVQLRAWADCGAGPERLEGVLESLDTEHPSHPACVRLIGDLAFEAGHMALARQLLTQQAAQSALDDMGEIRLRHLTLREQPPGALAGAADVAGGPGLPALAAYQAGLQPLAELLAHAPLHDSALDVPAIRQAARQALGHFTEHLRQGAQEVSMAEVLDAVSTFWSVANAGAWELRHWQGTFPFDFGPDFGTHDPLRASAQCDAVLQHLIALVRHALSHTGRWRLDTPEASLSDLMQLVRWGAEAHLALGQPDEALSDLAQLRQRLGPLGVDALLATEEQLCLAAGHLDRAAAVRARLPRTGEWAVWPLQPWQAWAAATQGEAWCLASDAAVPGDWDIVSPQGQTRQAHHAALATEVVGLRCRDLVVRNSHLLLHAQAGILQPHAWHRQMGPFPFPHPTVLNRGLKGAALAAGAAPIVVDEPLVVLANMDATYHRNYYHWMVLALTRIVLALEQGLLDGRRLLLPQELAGWMKTSLRDVGLEERQLRWYRHDEVLALSDAWVLGPLEFASATANERLRQRLWRAAGLDPDQAPTPTRCLYLTRAGEFRRPFLEENEVAALAAELGYECLAPERLPLLEQVRLFAQARVVAGPPGAAFTNLMWAQAGTQVLSFFKAEINGPTFLDLSFLRGQRHRWVQGSSVPGFEAVSVVTSPYSVDLAVARQALKQALTP